MMVRLLIAAVVLAGLGLGRAARRARSARARAAAGYAAVGLYLAAGLLVLNLEARAWPGLYLGGSRLLSQLLGGRRLFEIAEAVAVLAAGCAAARRRLADGRPRLAAALSLLQALAVVGCALVAGLGFLCAALVWRLSE